MLGEARPPASNLEDAEPLRLHVEMLVREGLTLSNIARKAGTSVPQLSTLRQGRRTYVTKKLAAGLRAVTPADKEPARGRKPVEHGTIECYRRGCREAECKKANTDTHRAYLDRRAGGHVFRVSAEKARVHVAMLRVNGVAVNVIAARAGRPPSTIHNLLGSVNYPNGNLTIGVDLERAILAVKLRDCRRGRYEPSEPLRYLLEDMALRQWSMPEIGPACGVVERTLRKILRNENPQIDRATAASIRQFFIEHRSENGTAAKAANWARRHGYLPAWRTVPEFVTSVMEVSRPVATNLALEHELELRLRIWLEAQNDSEPWAELSEAQQRFLRLRFALRQRSLPTVPEFSNRYGVEAVPVRQRTYRGVRSLTADARTSVKGFERELEVYLTDPGLRALAA